jgi:hypothetical protein
MLDAGTSLLRNSPWTQLEVKAGGSLPSLEAPISSGSGRITREFSMPNRRSNRSLWLGALFLVLAFVLGSLPFFAQIPGQAALPWLNLLLGAAAVAIFIRGLLLAKRQPALYRGKAAGWTLTVLSSVLFLFSLFAYYASRHIPEAKAAPQVGQKAPDFELKDTSGQTASLAQLLASPVDSGKAGSQPKAVLLVFYRGYW